ncbi:hypothetical protein D7B24_008253 [Verticillium nonalfalfae]|uniref:beta-glucosidase n=1 Tax=Verticillium nonalfalfae TaxID=1051616 RepID=A0A3M9Y7J6_9PEZI|nr:uncharacterized protein D7B24_008253 [Verticillium nonalfalfae]RNJ55726.1 hypothetical protein D7B24_008253 [Verticillium nonalfalfae]
MTIEEKAGQMYHARALLSPSGEANTGSMIKNQFITHFVYQGGVNDVDAFIDWFNERQQQAHDTRLGIPVTFSTDPQHGWTQDSATANMGLSFSRWTEPMGLAAMRSPETARVYADVVRQELAAVGIRQVLYPQVDLATEPRWGRTGLTFGEDANLTTAMVLPMLEGFRGKGKVADSVIATVKHFPGAGPMENGADAHFPWGKNTTWPGSNLDQHLQPFKAAIDAGAPQIMPYYSRPRIDRWEPIGFAFNKPVITGLLKQELGFEGIILTDFGILSIAPWGLEDKTPLERTWYAVEAGVDIIGGESSTQHLIKLVKDGNVTESRIDHSVRKLLKQKFELGLFDKPFADKKEAAGIVGNEEFRRLGNSTQRDSLTLLTNKNDILPLPRSAQKAKIYAEGIPPGILESRGLTAVSDPKNADFAFLRLASPAGPPDAAWPASYAINNGSLEFTTEEQKRQAAIYEAVPTIVDIKMNRPAVIPEIADKAAALFASYGSSPDAFLDVVFRVKGAEPKGKLPFDMASSDQAVDDSFEDLPFDTKDAVFRFGHGLRYNVPACIPGPKPENKKAQSHRQ